MAVNDYTKDQTLIPTGNETTPVSEEDLALIRAALERQPIAPLGTPTGGPVGSPFAPGPDTPTPNASVAEQAAQAVPMQQEEIPLSPRDTQPLPQPGIGAELASAFAGVPILGKLAVQPMKEIQRKREQMINQDTQALAFLDQIMQENPRQAGQLIKSPLFRDAMLRQKGAGDEDIMNISKVLSDPKLSVGEQTSILAASGMVDEEGKIMPRPLSVEVESKREREDMDKFVEAALQANPNWTDFDALMAWYSAGKRGSTTKGFDIRTPAGSNKGYIVNKDNGAVTEFDIARAKKYTIYPLESDDGFEGLMFANPEDPNVHGFVSPRTLFPDMSEEDLRRITGDRRTFFQKLRDSLERFWPGAGDQLFTNFLSSNQAAGLEEVPLENPADLPEGSTFVGPAINQTPAKATPSELTPAQKEAAGVL